MNHYETIFIVAPDTSEVDQDSIFEKVKSTISEKGKMILFDDWGNKKFAYEIKKKKQGRFVRLDYCGKGELVDEIERSFRLDYRILKYMTVLLAKNVDPESLVIPETESEATEAKPEAENSSSAETAETETAEAEATEAESTEAESTEAESTEDEAVETETPESDSETEE